MHYTNYFKEIATTAKEEGIYIGMGNPNGKILIIGKELAIDEEKEKHDKRKYALYFQYWLQRRL